VFKTYLIPLIPKVCNYLLLDYERGGVESRIRKENKKEEARKQENKGAVRCNKYKRL
jgi:hypothetical protein